MTTATLPTYPFDPTGTLAACRIIGEQQTLSGANDRDHYTVIPNVAPIFREGAVFRLKNGPDVRDLVENVDFYFTHPFVSASRACAKEMFGSITFLNPTLTGVLKLDQYQTVGGDWVIDSIKIAEILSDQAHNPRITSWESVANLPYAFPVIDHEWDLIDMVGMSDVAEELSKIELAMRQKGTDGLLEHVSSRGNVHGLTAGDIDAYTKPQADMKTVQLAAAAVQAHAGQSDPHPQYLTESEVLDLIRRQAGRVGTPRNVTPAAGATNVSITATLISSAYQSLYGIAQTGAEFQVSNKQDFSQVLVNSGVLGAVTQYAITGGIVANSAYFWRCRHRDAENTWSEWSTPTAFATGSVLVNQPSLTTPTPGQTGIPTAFTMTSSAFAVTGGVDTHASSDWEIWTGPNASGTRVFNLAGSSASKVSAAVPAGTLQPNMVYYARVRHNATGAGASAWSTEVNFTTAGVVAQPIINSPVNGSTDVGETPVISSNAFSVIGGNDTHASTDYQVWTGPNGTGTKVHELLGSTTEKLSTMLPAGKLATSTTYYARMRHNGATLGSSAWSADSAFTTAASFVPTQIGTLFQGGYYYGRMKDGVDTYALIVAPKASGTLTGRFDTTNIDPNITSRFYGYPNTVAAAALDPTSVAVQARAAAIGGYNDWYLPSLDEVELLYRAFKPDSNLNSVDNTQNPDGFNGVNPNSVPAGQAYSANNPAVTVLSAFKAGGSEAFFHEVPSSTYDLRSEEAVVIFGQTFSNSAGAIGSQLIADAATSKTWRLVRRVKINS